MQSTRNTISFEVHTLEWIRLNRWQENRVCHRHTYFEIIWVREGSGIHLIDLEAHPVADDVIYCLTPGQTHRFNEAETCKGYVISFSSEFLSATENNYDLLVNSGLFNKVPRSFFEKLPKETEFELIDLVEKMIKEYDNFFLLRSELLRGYLKIFLLLLSRQFKTVQDSSIFPKKSDLVKRFFTLLEKNFISKKMVTEYADELHITPNYLNEIIKKNSGFSASYHIQQRIILEAKRQAIYSNVSMKEVAYQLGFEDMAHFSKFFKNVSGINFTDFKRKLTHPFTV